MTDENQWTIRTGGALSAHFFQPDGSSRPGTDWIVELERGESAHKVLVRAYLSADMTRRVRADEEYQRRTVLDYVRDLLGRGWTPDQESELAIVIQNPTGDEDLAAYEVMERVAPQPQQPVVAARKRRKGFYYFVGFFGLAGVSLLILIYGPTRPDWLPLVPIGIGFLLLIAAVIAERRYPV